MTTDPHLNTGAMALGALPGEEATAYLQHLDSCEVCNQELASFRQTAAILGSTVARTPPASLRTSVMAAISRTPQLPPLTDPTPAGDRQGGSDVSPPQQEDGSERPTATVTELRRPWYRRPQGLIAAAIALLVLGGGVGVVLSRSSTAPSSADPACVATAADRSTQTPAVGEGGTVAFAPSCDTAVVNMPKLPPPPAGQVYQLWVLSGQHAASAGVVNQNADGSVPPVTTPIHLGNTAVGVTLEPAPGPSAQPTSKPIWVVPLTA